MPGFSRSISNECIAETQKTVTRSSRHLCITRPNYVWESGSNLWSTRYVLGAKFSRYLAKSCRLLYKGNRHANNMSNPGSPVQGCHAKQPRPGKSNSEHCETMRIKKKNSATTAACNMHEPYHDRGIRDPTLVSLCAELSKPGRGNSEFAPPRVGAHEHRLPQNTPGLRRQPARAPRPPARPPGAGAAPMAARQRGHTPRSKGPSACRGASEREAGTRPPGPGFVWGGKTNSYMGALCTGALAHDTVSQISLFAPLRHTNQSRLCCSIYANIEHPPREVYKQIGNQ